MSDIKKDMIVNALPYSVIVLNEDNFIIEANIAAQAFFEMGLPSLRRQRLAALLPFGSPLLQLVEEARRRHSAVNEYRLDLGLPRLGGEKRVDVHCAPLVEQPGGLLLIMQERSIADKIDRQLTHRGAARSVTALAAMLAHEIKNPLSGIKGAAQLLEGSAPPEDHILTRLICDEADRIVKLVDRMEAFSDAGPVAREAVNIHVVLEHVRRLAENGFGRHVRFEEAYDPSLPPVYGNRDQLVQVFLNLVKNAAEATEKNNENAEITLSTAFRPGVHMRMGPQGGRMALPLEVTVRDNGSGIASDILPYLFDPFLTTKASGSGLGLALVAKIIGDHGGVVECDSQPRRTVFRILLPMAQQPSPPKQRG